MRSTLADFSWLSQTVLKPNVPGDVMPNVPNSHDVIGNNNILLLDTE